MSRHRERNKPQPLTPSICPLQPKHVEFGDTHDDPNLQGLAHCPFGNACRFPGDRDSEGSIPVAATVQGIPASQGRRHSADQAAGIIRSICSAVQQGQGIGVLLDNGQGARTLQPQGDIREI